MVKKYYSGLTLVELMIVLAIIAVLAALVIAYLSNQLFKGNDAKRKGDIDRIKIAVEEYEKDHDCYPLPQTIDCRRDGGIGLKPYLNKIPCDPITKASYYYEYEDSVCPRWFRIYTVLQNTNDIVAIPGIGPNDAFNYVQSSGNAPGVVGNSTPTPSSSVPTPSPSGSVDSGFYGCNASAACVSIPWDSSRPGPECDPNYQSSNCYGQCGPASNECLSWK
jgi:prepilin-type N-terminal cleavage/methylation domain-containing protein